MTHCRIIYAAVIGLALCGAPAIAQTSGSAPAQQRLKALQAKSSSKTPQANQLQTTFESADKKVEIRAWADRTAIWVADRVTYTIEITCQPGVEILTADLVPEKLPLSGFEIAGNDIDQEVEPGDVRIYTFRYYLTTYKVDATTLQIGAMVVRYYAKREGQQLGDVAPLGEVQIPAVPIAFRSLLLDDPQKLMVRSYQGAAARPRQYEELQSIGIGLIVISVLPAMFFLAKIARRVWLRAHPSPLEEKLEDSKSLEQVRVMDVTTVEGRRDAYARLNALVRGHLLGMCGVDAPSLTPGEISSALSARGSQVSDELVTSVLTACELALYAPVEALPSAEACRMTMEQAGRVLTAGR